MTITDYISDSYIDLRKDFSVPYQSVYTADRYLISGSQNGISYGYCYLINTFGELTHHGNIGCYIEDVHRRKGYAFKACKLLFTIAKFQYKATLYITCDKDNMGSYNLCKKLGGIWIGFVSEDNLLTKKERITSRHVFEFSTL